MALWVERKRVAKAGTFTETTWEMSVPVPTPTLAPA